MLGTINKKGEDYISCSGVLQFQLLGKEYVIHTPPMDTNTHMHMNVLRSRQYLTAVTCMVHTSLVPRPSMPRRHSPLAKTSNQYTPVKNMIPIHRIAIWLHVQSDEMFFWLLYTQYTQAVNHYVTTVLKFIHRHSPYQHAY